MLRQIDGVRWGWFCVVCFLLISCGRIEALQERDGLATPIAASVDQLILIEYNNYPDFRLSQFDVDTRATDPLFEVEPDGWINQIDFLAATNSLALSYTPPPVDETAYPFDRAGLYTLALDTPPLELQPVYVPDQADLFYFNPVWTPDGRYLFYITFIPDPTARSRFDVALWRYELATEATLKIADDGIWPRVSPDGQKLTYITVDPETLERGLVVTDLAGDNLVQLLKIGAYFDLDSPFFTIDSQHIYFAASLANPAISQHWWEPWLGVQVAQAHVDQPIPTDWWRMPATGGEPERLTSEELLIIFGSLGSDGLIYFSASDGLYVANPADGKIQRLVEATNLRNFAIQLAQ